MYGDTAVIRRLAGDLRQQAGDIRAEADDLLARAEGVGWQGRAADAMRTRARGRVAALRRSAAEHDDAAQALDRHAAAVDRLTALIAAIEQRAHQLVTEVDELLARFVAPHTGHRDWLTVELPGLHR